MTAWLLLATLVTQADAAAIQEAWTAREGRVEKADVSISVLRDSRDASFGAPIDAPLRPTIRLMFDRQSRQLTAPRLTAVRQDGRTQPAEWDPDRARIEFRNVLLEERLAGPQMVPETEPATWFIGPSGEEEGQRLAPIDQMLGEAPLWNVRPGWLFPRDQELAFVPVDAEGSAIKSVVEVSRTQQIEVWAEPAAPYRVVRVIRRELKRPVAQTDLFYAAADDGLPSRWFVQTLGAAGEPLAFSEAERSGVVLNQPLDQAEFGRLTEANSDLPPKLDRGQISRRQSLRWLLDFAWIPAGVIALASVLVGWRRG